MAIRMIRKEGEDEILRKRSREVEKVDDRIRELLDDMAETMYDANGVGLAAVQVGVLKRVIVVDDGDGLVEIVNPVIVEEEGEIVDAEGCLSCPNLYGEVKRPKRVLVKGLDRNGKEISVRGESLLGRALCHEIDHLDGILFIDKVIRYIDRSELRGGGEEEEE